MRFSRRLESGVTLIEMMVVVTLIAVIGAVSFPSVASGLESLRLSSASESIVSFLNTGLNRAERLQQPIEITISKAENTMWLRSVDPSFVRRLEMPEGVTIAKILPEMVGNEEAGRAYLIYPGGVVPRFGIELSNKRGRHRIVRVDPITGVPQIETLE